jgi:uncharacterized membrane protein YgaE (UPF0421/DUF939 family)
MTERLLRSVPRRAATRRALLRLRARAWPILQTAGAAVAAWYAAKLLLPEREPVFAPIAAVVALGAAYGQRRERAVELVGGVVLGIGVADLLVGAIGSGGWQIGVMVLLAMSVAVGLGGGAILVTEAAVSAILLVLLEPSGSGLPPSRLVEALVGGGVALAVAALAFPPDPVLQVGRAVQAIFGGLGRTLEEVAAALDATDMERAQAALAGARQLDGAVRALDEALAEGRETARFAPGRRASRTALDRYERPARHVDFAVRNTRVLARHSLRFVRGGGEVPPELPDAIRSLALAVWALGAALETSEPQADEVRRHASRAAARATESFEGRRDLGLAEIVAQVRSTAIDLVRASEAATAPDQPSGTRTEELFLEDAGSASEVPAGTPSASPAGSPRP